MRQPDCISLIGSREAGKGNLAFLLAANHGLQQIDTERIFKLVHRKSIAEYIAVWDWPAFHAEQEHALRQAIQPSTIIIPSNEELDSSAYREMLSRDTLVVWVRAQLHTIVERLRDAPEYSPLKEQQVLCELRNSEPYWSEMATITVPTELPLIEQQEMVLRALEQRV